jgi:hypothetical protein
MKKIIRPWIKKLIELSGYTIRKIDPEFDRNPIYSHDGLRTVHNHDFMDDPAFQRAYNRGVLASKGLDHQWYWRVHIGLWAAFSACKLDGDFVECGVNRGFLSSAIMTFLDWDSCGKMFYLLDTFQGLDERVVSEAELEAGALEKNQEHLTSGFYVSGVESVKENFSEWKNWRIIQGTIPDTLENVDALKIAYLHIDLNCSPPEVAALEFFWDRLVPGAFILLDDYAFHGYRPSKLGMDDFAQRYNLRIASLPTGQGLLLKPPISPNA